MFEKPERYLLISSIAYGYFQFEARLESVAIKKMMLHGHAYVDAYLDTGRDPKPRAGMCRIVTSHNGERQWTQAELESLSANKVLSDGGEHYFYWMVRNIEEIPRFRAEFNNTGPKDYSSMKNVISRYVTCDGNAYA